MPASNARAHQAVNRALKAGVLVKPSDCEQCGVHVEKSRDLHAHHANYDKPLEVKWLCRRCHRRAPEASAVGTVSIQLPLSDELRARVDNARGDISRIAWIRQAIQHRIDDQPNSKEN